MRVSIGLVLVFVFLCGCGGGATVKGKVTFEDGSPLTQGAVKFVTETTEATGDIKSNGTYTLFENKPGDGITPGKYAVTVTAVTGGGSDGAPVVNLVDSKFANPATSGLSCEVKGSMTYDIKVSKPE